MIQSLSFRTGPVSAGLIVAAATLAWTCAAQAQPAPSNAKDLGVSGSIPNLCVLGQFSQSDITPLVNAASIGTGTVEILNLRDETTLSTASASISLAFDGMCNYPHRLSLESSNNGLFRTNATTENVAGFGTAIPYTATISWGGVDTVFEAYATRRGISNKSQLIASPSAGALQLSVLIRAGATNTRDGAPLVGGLFSDTLRITVEPQ